MFKKAPCGTLLEHTPPPPACSWTTIFVPEINCSIREAKVHQEMHVAAIYVPPMSLPIFQNDECRLLMAPLIKIFVGLLATCRQDFLPIGVPVPGLGHSREGQPEGRWEGGWDNHVVQGYRPREGAPQAVQVEGYWDMYDDLLYDDLLYDDLQPVHLRNNRG
eukprot:gene14810-biopygen4064